MGARRVGGSVRVVVNGAGGSGGTGPAEPAGAGSGGRAGAGRRAAGPAGAAGARPGTPLAGSRPGDAVDVVVLAGGTGRRLGGVSKADVLVGGRRMIDHLLDGLAGLVAAGGGSDAGTSTRSTSGTGVPGAPVGARCQADQPGTGAPAGGGPALRRVVVVAPDDVALPGWVGRALEDPPLGGPVAGIAAGLAQLASPASAGSTPPAPWTAVLTCDAPAAWRALPALVARAHLQGVGGDGPGAGGAPDEHRGVPADDQPDAIVARIDGVDQPLLALYRTASLAERVAPGGVVRRDVAVRRTLAGLRAEQVDVDRAARDLDTWDDLRSWSAPS